MSTSSQQGYAERLKAVEARSLKAAQERPVAAAIVKVIEAPEFEDFSTAGHSGFVFRSPQVKGLADEMIDALLAARKEKVNPYENARRATTEEITQAEAGEIPVIETGHSGTWLHYTF